jgi:hypothetical protein
LAFPVVTLFFSHATEIDAVAMCSIRTLYRMDDKGMDAGFDRLALSERTNHASAASLPPYFQQISL